MKHSIMLMLVVSMYVYHVYSGEYHIDKSQSNLVKFISDAPLEDFEGVTDKIDGYMYWEGDNLIAKSQIYFEVDLNSIDTGIGLRNRHMQENYLETDKYPLTHFIGKLISASQLPDSTYQVTAKGKMFIHGIEKDMSADGKMIPFKDGFRIQTDFIVTLTDFNIEVPQMMFFKIDEDMQLKLDFYIMRLVENE